MYDLHIVAPLFALMAVLLAVTWRRRRRSDLLRANATIRELNTTIDQFNEEMRKAQSAIDQLRSENRTLQSQLVRPVPFLANARIAEYNEKIRIATDAHRAAETALNALANDKERLANEKQGLFKELDDCRKRLQQAEAGRVRAEEGERMAIQHAERLGNTVSRQRQEHQSRLLDLQHQIDEMMHRTDASIQQLIERLVATIHAWRAEMR